MTLTVHPLDKANMQAAGKVIARGDHPAKAETGYAVMEATYAGGKKAYFYDQHGRYSSDTSSSIKEGAGVYASTTTHPKPMRIKSEYIQTLKKGRSPQIPVSADYVARRKAGRPGADEKNRAYEHGRARRITWAGALCRGAGLPRDVEREEFKRPARVSLDD